MNVRSMRNEVLGTRVVKAIESRNMEAYYVKTKEEALAKALELIPEKSTVSWGGCESAKEIGLLDALHNGDYEVLDREDKMTREEKQEVARKALTCDVFIGSTNAVSEDGVMVNIDGNANRVAAEERGAHCGHEQSGEKRGGCHEPGAQRGGSDKRAAFRD